MSYGNITFEFDGLKVFNSIDDPQPKEVDIEIELYCIYPGEAPSGLFGPPEYYDPGSPPEWEIDSIGIYIENSNALQVTEKQFADLFPNGTDIMNNALEYAAEKGIVDVS